MRAVIQRVSEARVRVEGIEIAAIGRGLLVYLAVKEDDTEADIDYIIRKITGLRIFPDSQGRMNLSALEVGAELLIVSQFTLYGDARKGRRPSYSRAGSPERARQIYDKFIDTISQIDIAVETGEFQAMMDVESINDGPVTILLDSERIF